MASPKAPIPGFIFIFISVFGEEGGIQSYGQDWLRAYQRLLPSLGPTLPSYVLILRDRGTEANPFRGQPHWFFQGYKSPVPQWERATFTLGVLWHLLRHRPQRLFCGHINLLPLVAPLCGWLGIPYTVLTYGKEVWEPLPPRQQRYLRRADRLVTISRYSRDRACQANGLDPQAFALVPCGVDGDRFCPGDPNPDLVQRYGLQGCRVLLTVARLWSGDIYKGVDVTLRALPQILAQEPTVKYLVIGRGDDQPRLQQLAQDLGVAQRVVFAGFVATESLPDHYRLAQGYVMPSQEGFGIVYLESMACGVPVVAGDRDGSADPLQDGRTGWRVPHRDPAAVAQACLALLRGGDRRCDPHWLRQQALAHFSPDALAHSIRPLMTQDRGRSAP